VNEKLDELGGNVDEALIQAEELANEPGAVTKKRIKEITRNLEDARDGVDELENEDSEG
jgi:transcription elongation GreA/GreB family factor